MWLQQRKSYQADERCYSHQQRVANLRPKQDDQTTYRDQCSKPIANCNPAEQYTSSQDRADGSAIRPLNKPLHIQVLSMPDEDRRNKEDEQKRGQKDSTVDTKDPQKPPTR